MAQTVKLKRSNTAGTIPTTSNLALGEVAINTKDGKFFLRKHVDGSTGDAIHAYAPQGINAYGTQELVVKVVTKTTAHPNHGNGSSSGYTVQGLEGPFLALIPGNTYKFDVSDSTNSGHPFRFYLDAAKATAYTTGVTTSGSAGNSGAYVQIAVTTSTPQVLYYQCSSHSLMGSAAYVASDAIAANAVGTSQIAQNSITSSEIPDNSIGATQISAAVLAAKQDNLGNNSITAAMISQNTVGISELNVSDGSNGQVLTTDGSGTLSFSTVSGGGGGTVSEAFKTISVSGQSNVVADGATDTLTLAGSGGMTITTTAGTDTVTFSSSTTPADDSVTTAKITDLNVTAGKLAANSVTSAKIATDAVGASEIAANSVGISELNVSDGSANQVLTTDGSGTLSFANPSAGTVTEAFKTLAVSGQDNVVADAATDTLTFAAGSNMTITTNASNDTITFASSGSGGSSSSFAKNTFSGDGSTTAFTLTTSMSNENGLIVFIDGVYQADNVYSVSGTTLTFATAPVNGRVIEVFQLEGGIVGTAPILATMTGDGSDTTLALGTTPSSENQCFVTIDGVMQHKSTYSVSGSTLTFSTAPPNGTAVEAITLTNTTVATFQDSDGDTKIQMEESNDEDKIRFDTGGTERMIIDDAGKVGIGASTLHKNLNIHTSDSNSTNIVFTNSATGTGSTDGFYVGIDSNESPEFWNYENTDLIIGLNNAEKFRIKADGKVGIGTSSPAEKLEVSGDIKATKIGMGISPIVPCEVLSTGTTSTALRVLKSGSDDSTQNNLFSVTEISGHGRLSIHDSSQNEDIRLDSNGASYFTGGKVIIGDTQTSAASDLLQIETPASGGGHGIQIRRNDSNADQSIGRIMFGNNTDTDLATISAKTEGNNDSGALQFFTQATSGSSLERVRIGNSGHFLVGTSSIQSTSGEGFKVNGSNGVCYSVMDTSVGTASNYLLYNENSSFNGFRFYVQANGGIANYSTNDSNLSDERVKTNIELSGNYLEKICNIPVKLFNYKDEPEDKERSLGVIAQDVEAVAPELVNNEGFGETPEDGVPLKTVYTTDMMYALMKAMQEQQVIIDDLKARIETLEG